MVLGELFHGRVHALIHRFLLRSSLLFSRPLDLFAPFCDGFMIQTNITSRELLLQTAPSVITISRMPDVVWIHMQLVWSDPTIWQSAAIANTPLVIQSNHVAPPKCVVALFFLDLFPRAGAHVLFAGTARSAYVVEVIASWTIPRVLIVQVVFEELLALDSGF